MYESGSRKGRELVVARTREVEVPRRRKKPSRKSAYKPEFCPQVIELGKQGKSPAQIASVLGHSTQTLAYWCKRFKEFGEAMARAKTEEQAWWEDTGRKGMMMGSGGFNGLVWKTAMQARFRNDYTERREVQGGTTFQLIISAKDKELL